MRVLSTKPGATQLTVTVWSQRDCQATGKVDQRRLA